MRHPCNRLATEPTYRFRGGAVRFVNPVKVANIANIANFSSLGMVEKRPGRSSCGRSVFGLQVLLAQVFSD
jgi:hypothetical protein